MVQWHVRRVERLQQLQAEQREMEMQLAGSPPQRPVDDLVD